MKWLALAVLVVGLSVATAWFIGTRMSPDHIARVAARYSASPDALWAKISDPSNAASWRKELTKVDVLASGNGKFAWRETAGRDVITYEMESQSAPKSQVTRITDESLPFGGQWEYELTPDGNGTVLKITERGFVRPALFRVLSRTVFSLTSTMETYHRSLAAALNEPSRITSSTVEQ
jgi:hypothetical protein